MQSKGLITPSNSPWASPIHMVPKKDGTWPICGDYRRLNTVTIPDKYPVKRLQDFTAILADTKIFSTLDMQKAYMQIPLASEHRAKSAVITPFGLFEFNVMTFRMRNAAQTFQRYADSALGDLPYVFVYLDDILIASSSLEEHKRHLRVVLERLRDFGLQLNLDKCHFGLHEVEFLGFLINKSGYKPLPAKIDKISNFPRPQTVDELRRFLGMINFYHECIPHLAHLQIPLHKHTSGNKKKDKSPITWDDESLSAFEACKQRLADAALLAFPVDTAPIRICSDASSIAMGGVLEQQYSSGQWFPLSFFSRKFNNAQRNYSTYDRELTAAVESIKHFQYYVESRKFILGTDHKPLLQALSQKHEKAIPRRARQLEYFSLFEIEMVYLPGIHNNVADALSRIESLYEISAIDQDTYAMLNCINAFKFPTAIDMGEFCNKQAEDQELSEILKDPLHPLKLAKFSWPVNEQFFYANVQDNNIRPFLPKSLRKAIFDTYHGLSHPNGRVTDRLIRRSYVWPNMTRDITNWCKCCLDCQQSKISRYNKLSPAQFTAPDARFQHIHVDLVGPLPP
ncbi:hypothetical protein TKK_0015736 [Trichogramma kaykai]